jgi:glycosyltransferase involved in cell wall biosynthesis
MLHLACGLHGRGFCTAVVAQLGSPAARKAQEAGIEVHELAMRGEADLLASCHLAAIVRAGRFNLLHSHTAHSHMLVVWAARLWTAPARVVVHRRIEFAVGRRAFGLGRLKYRWGVDAYVAISNRVKETLLEGGVPEWRVFPVHSATDPARFLRAEPNPALRRELGIPEDAFLVGNIGALVPHKDHRNLLEAARIVRDQIPNAWFVIVGAGPLHATILGKARALHMTDRVIMTGFRRDVPELIRTFDLFALSSSEEGICSTLLDVAASGCPIVATDAGGVREAVLPGETGVVVPTRSARALAHGILEMARDSQTARRMAARGRERILSHFTAERMTERTLDVYSRVLAGSVGPAYPVGFLPQ